MTNWRFAPPMPKATPPRALARKPQTGAADVVEEDGAQQADEASRGPDAEALGAAEHGAGDDDVLERLLHWGVPPLARRQAHVVLGGPPREGVPDARAGGALTLRIS